MKVLLLTSPAPSWSPFFTGEKRPPLGVWSLIGTLRKAGHDVGFIDLYVEDQELPPVSGYDYVGIYANTICFDGTLRVLNELRRRRAAGWKGKILVGGPHTTPQPESIPAWVDHVVQGEGERAILDIVEGREQRRLFRAERIPNLDDLARPSYDLIDRYQYSTKFQAILQHVEPVFTMNTSRGCPRSCTFCSVGSVWGRRYTAQSSRRVVDDMAWLQRDFGARGIYFREDEFTMVPKRVRGICEKLVKADLGLTWMCEARCDSLEDPDLVKLMAAAGCRGLYIGVESGSDRMLTEVFNKGITTDQIRKAFAHAHAAGILPIASLLKQTGYETAEDYRLTDALLKEIRPAAAWHNPFTGIPYSPLYERMVKEKRYERIDSLGLLFPRLQVSK